MKKFALSVLILLTAICAALGFSACGGMHESGDWDENNGVYFGLIASADCPDGNIVENKVASDLQMQLNKEYYLIIDFNLQTNRDNDGRGFVNVFVKISPAVTIDVGLEEASSGTHEENFSDDLKEIKVQFLIPDQAKTVKQNRIVLRLKPLLGSDYIVSVAFDTDISIAGNLTKNEINKTISSTYTKELVYSDVSDGYSVSTSENFENATEIIIPQLKDGKFITEIGRMAFYGFNELTSVSIPNSVLRIDDYAFYGCNKLTNISIPNSVITIGWGAFEKCSELSNITIPNSVVSIEGAFADCTGLTSITLSNSLTNIGEGTFSGCSGLTSIKIPNGVTSIGESAFNSCSSLTSITIPDSVKSIGNGAFGNCGELTTITIPGNITSIGSWSFLNCNKLDKIIFKGSISKWCSIYYIDSLMWSVIENKTLIINGIEISGELKIPDNVKEISRYAFDGCREITSLVIGNRVENINQGAFFDCSSLTSIVIPKSMKNIDNAFAGCSELSKVYYCGSEKDWDAIDIYKLGNDNLPLFMSTRYYYSETQPEGGGNYWHYVDGQPVIW